MSAKITISHDKRNKKCPWVCRWSGDINIDTGKHRRYAKSFRLKADAENFAAQKRTEFAQGSRRDEPDNITLKGFCREFIRMSQVRPQTVKLYENTIRRLLDFFRPDTPLQQITPHSAAKFTASQRPYSHRIEKLSSYTVHRIIRNAKTIFAMAVEWGYIRTNPFKSVKRPKCIGKPWHYVTPDEYLRLIDAAPTLRWKAFDALAYTAGLRLGELLSLTWNDIDFDKGEVRVQNRPATAKLPPFFIKDYEQRTIPLPEHTLNILLKLHTEAPEVVPYVVLTESEYRIVCEKWRRYQKQGRPWNNWDMQNNTLKTFKRHIKRAGIKANGTLAIHTLRKACITNWANEINNPEVVRVLAGHSNLATTMRYYSKATKQQREKAAAAIDTLLSAAVEKVRMADVSERIL